MSRYIRTKDGKIYDTDRYAYHWSTPRFIGLGISINESVLIPKSDLVKEPTDKLPELCDAFVTVTKDGQKHTYHSYDGCVLAMMKCEEEKIEIKSYGAIWVTGKDGEPILRSVAKMNEKGELELL